nr:PREDICTED: testicular acid phosphatase homolog [Bemisia tabaci]
MYELGKFLRHRNSSFLSEIYKPKEIFVSTLNTDRIIISGQLVLAGLYPPVGIQIWNTDLPWQPIPLHFVPTSCDDTQQALDLPRWAQYIYPEKIKSLAEMEFMEFFKTPTTIKLQSGVFINEIVSNMNRKIDAMKNFERLLHLYPVSDRVIVRLWKGLNISQEITNKPNYEAALFIELHEINNKYRVKILHKEGTLDDKLRTLKTRGCEDSHNLAEDEMCDLEVFSSALESIIITDFDEACKNMR